MIRFFRFLFRWGAPAAHPAPAIRTFAVLAEARVFPVDSEQRVFAVANDPRQFPA